MVLKIPDPVIGGESQMMLVVWLQAVGDQRRYVFVFFNLRLWGFGSAFGLLCKAKRLAMQMKHP